MLLINIDEEEACSLTDADQALYDCKARDSNRARYGWSARPTTLLRPTPLTNPNYPALRSATRRCRTFASRHRVVAS
jgi:hypothetical protein